MKSIFALFLCAIVVYGCAKHDPVLPGVRQNIFDDGELEIKNETVPELSGTVKNIYGDADCDYAQDETNTIRNGDRKIYVGFATNNFVKSNQKPVCSGGYVYTGLSTGEVIKIKQSNRQVIWTSDVYKQTNLTGAAAVIDIIARVGIDDGYVYAGGLGDAFCKLNANNGNKIWCVNISVPVDFIIIDNTAFVVSSDNNLYAINTKDGNIYWVSEIKKQIKPEFKNNYITVGKQRINYQTGEIQ